MNKKVVYPGTFDPITNGHVDIVEKAVRIFDEVIVAVADSSSKKTLFSLVEREMHARDALHHLNNITVVSFDSLLIDFVLAQGAKVIVRGLRAASDFEFECQLAGMNRRLNKEIETVFLTPSEQHIYISSSLVREIASLHGNVSSFVSDSVETGLQKKFN